MQHSFRPDIKQQPPSLLPLSSPPPPPLPPHLCDNTETPSTPIPSRLERLQRKASEKWFNPLRLSSKRSSQQFLRHKQSTLSISPYSNDKKGDVLSPTPSSSSHLPYNKKRSRTEDIKRSRSFAYGHQSSNLPTSPITYANSTYTKTMMTAATPTLSPCDIYPALLSRVAYEFQQNMTLADHFKNGIEYKNCFTGQDALDHLVRILCTNDRFLALMVGRALGSQRFFHDVGYEHRLLDSVEELYQFEESNFVNNSNSNTLSSNSYPDDLLLHYCDSPTILSHDTAATASNSSVNNLYAPYPGDDIPSAKQSTVPFPNGVITDLTYCYSSTCHGSSPCYSYSCPRRRSMKRPDHHYQVLHSQEHPLWADLVSESEYNTISKQERKRQEGIYELIYTETNYVKDLEYIEEMWVQPLIKSDIIPESRRDEFVNTVFSNLSSVYAINIRLASALLARQKERLVVYAIGDIMLDFVVDFEPYIKYCARQFEAKYALERERYINPAFDWFSNETERLPVSHKLELNGYLTKPTTRMGKYLLILDEILKRTPPGHPDYDDIPKAIAIIKQFLGRVNNQAGNAKNRFDLERMHNNLVFKHKSDTMDLGLLKDSRAIIKQGVLRKSPSEGSTEYQIILLDHYLVVAKVKMGPGGELKYVVQKRPMSLDLLKVYVPITENREDLDINSNKTLLTRVNTSKGDDSSNRDIVNDGRTSNGSDLRPKKRPSSILPYVNINNTNSPVMLRPFNDSYQQANNNNNNGISDKISPSNTPTTTILKDRERKTGYPIAFDYLGRRNQSEALILYATSSTIRKPWIDKIIKQQKERQRRNKLLFEIVPAVEPGHFVSHTQVNHIVTFNNGQQYILAADDGVYVGHTSGKKTPNKVLSMQKVTQIEAVESAQMLLVLSDRTLWEYCLDVLNGKPESQPLGRRVQSHVPFFHVGRSLQSVLVCVPRVSTLKSTITTFEAISNGIINATGNDKNGNGNSGGDSHMGHKSDLKAAGFIGSGTIDNGGLANGNGGGSKSSNRNGKNSNKHITFSKPSQPGNEGTASRISAEFGRRKSMRLLDRVSLLHVGTQHHHEQSDLRLKRLKLSYVPCEVWSIELSPSKMLITSPRGMIMLDMKTDKPQQLLDPDDKRLKFITDREREESSHIRQPLKHIAIFRTPRGDHFVCYDEYGFYIDGKGNRLYPNFLVEWEGRPEVFAYQHPYVIAFEQSFIEVRHIITGELEQIICGSNIQCLNNGHKTEKALIFGIMWDKQRKQTSIFELQRTTVDQISSSS